METWNKQQHTNDVQDNLELRKIFGCWNIHMSRDM